MKRLWLRIGLALFALGMAAAIGVVSGVVPVKASSGHWPITAWFLHFAMERSVATHSIGIEAPALDDPRLVVRGAGHYHGSCAPCHGAPGVAPLGAMRAMTPSPPQLATHRLEYDAAELFTIVLHGVKFTGMPAWPALERDDEVWSVVAFLQRIDELDDAAYRALVSAPPSALDARMPAAVRDRCARCHGGDGLGGRHRAFPRLAGQRHEYLRDSLAAYARGERHSGMMEPVALPLSAMEIETSAAWYASLPSTPVEGASIEPALRARGAEIARRGLPERRIPACLDCHSSGDTTSERVYPILAHQDAEYLVQQLELFVAGERGGGPYGDVMETVAAHGLEEEEMRAVAGFFAGGGE